MTDFLAKAPTKLDVNWRAIVQFGRNVASYKFALAKTLIDLADRSDDRVPLEELAGPFSRHLCTHLQQVDKQATSQTSRYLDSCRAFNRGELSEEQLVDSTARLGFNNVIDAFHVVGTGPTPARFFMDERRSNGGGAIRLTDSLRRLTGSIQSEDLSEEAETRWNLVEHSWALRLPQAGIAVQADIAQNLLFVKRVRRVNLTRVRGALNAYQRGRCFYCRIEKRLGELDVDHFFPWILKERGVLTDADGVWNLVLSCRTCNRGERGKFAAVPASLLVADLHERNNWLVDSHHPLRETIMLQAGLDADTRASFLRARQRVALDALVHEWMPRERFDE